MLDCRAEDKCWADQFALTVDIHTIVHAVESSTAPGSYTKKVVFETGDKLLWVSDGLGNLTPKFTNPVRHNYDCDDRDLTDAKYYTKEGLEQRDYSREWFLLPPEKQTEIADNITDPGIFTTQEVGYENPWEHKLNQWMAGLSVIKNYANKSVAKATGTDISFWDEYSSSRGIQAQKNLLQELDL